MFKSGQAETRRDFFCLLRFRQVSSGTWFCLVSMLGKLGRFLEYVDVDTQLFPLSDVHSVVERVEVRGRRCGGRGGGRGGPLGCSSNPPGSLVLRCLYLQHTQTLSATSSQLNLCSSSRLNYHVSTPNESTIQ